MAIVSHHGSPRQVKLWSGKTWWGTASHTTLFREGGSEAGHAIGRTESGRARLCAAMARQVRALHTALLRECGSRAWCGKPGAGSGSARLGMATHTASLRRGGSVVVQCPVRQAAARQDAVGLCGAGLNTLPLKGGSSLAPRVTAWRGTACLVAASLGSHIAGLAPAIEGRDVAGHGLVLRVMASRREARQALAWLLTQRAEMPVAERRGPAMRSTTRRGEVGQGHAGRGAARSGKDWRGYSHGVRSRASQSGPVRQAVVRSGLVWPVAAMQGFTHCRDQRGSSEALRGQVGHGGAGCGLVGRGYITFPHGKAAFGEARPGDASRGPAWSGMANHTLRKESSFLNHEY